ncbi:hypothetical protein [uncultured Stenotrophomonas sp.]|uniref:hypothetical protein n=1 Tax=uncultured Stenotrophomonas sp. TaxID=165438 RepID=UPI0028D596B3|nr:hypothetical protein [uncultured Stenotrophomonas sp.]
MPSLPRVFGAFALWATLCVVLLACAWPGSARTQASSDSQAQLIGTPAGQHAVDASVPGQPGTPVPETPSADKPGADATADAEAGGPIPAARPKRAAWVAAVPLWPADALRWQRLEPSLRLNPGHATPRA